MKDLSDRIYRIFRIVAACRLSGREPANPIACGEGVDSCSAGYFTKAYGWVSIDFGLKSLRQKHILLSL